MRPAGRSFQVFAKPAGSACNLACQYCYYLDKGLPSARGSGGRMPDGLLEEYIAQHIAASPDEIIRFSWHGGEPTVLGVGFFRRVVELEHRHSPPDRRVVNGMQTNGTLLDEEWGAFLAEAEFSVGLSLDGPAAMHDRFRLTRDGRPAFREAMRGYEILRRHGVPTDILCVVNAHNVRRPYEVYKFFKSIGASFISFLPLVEPLANSPGSASRRSVPAESWGKFLCAVFDEWLEGDIGRIKVQVFEEAARSAFGQEHSLCIFRPVCGDIPVVERNGDFYSCDHFVDEEHRLGNIRKTPLVEMLDSPAQRQFGRAKLEKLPETCRNCEVRDMCNGECPKNRFLSTPEGEPGWNYLCPGYKRFFTHCRPFVETLAAEWRHGRT
ncbi:MAG: anaerobic sulfatase maturase [Candidatus Aminicenantes bacterium RBG_13_62_12]|nr:MAG: anaerobic sulfatase maturase [Candidatus Aminicenantes bacterium RBG_13_62_12]